MVNGLRNGLCAYKHCFVAFLIDCEIHVKRVMLTKQYRVLVMATKVLVFSKFDSFSARDNTMPLIISIRKFRTTTN